MSGRVTITVVIDDMNGTNGQSAVVHEFTMGVVTEQVFEAAQSAALQAVEDWSLRRHDTRRGAIA